MTRYDETHLNVHCPTCGYDLSAGAPHSLRCPECGLHLVHWAEPVPWVNTMPARPANSPIFGFTLMVLVFGWIGGTGLGLVLFLSPELFRRNPMPRVFTPGLMFAALGFSAVPLLTAIVWESGRRRVTRLHWGGQLWRAMVALGIAGAGMLGLYLLARP